MEETRKIRENEKALVLFLLSKLDLKVEDYPINEEVLEYEGGKMGSISFTTTGADDYAGDMIQVQYIDSDSIPVVITLTKDSENRLLDLDFWKTDFSKLLTYPRPDQLIFTEEQAQ